MPLRVPDAFEAGFGQRQTGRIPNPYQTDQTTADDFGAGQGRALKQVAQGLDAVAQVTGRFAEDMAEERDRNAMLRVWSAYSKENSQLGIDLDALQGKDALDSVDKFTEGHNTLVSLYSEQVPKRNRAQFEEIAARDFNQGRERYARHVSDQLKADSVASVGLALKAARDRFLNAQMDAPEFEGIVEAFYGHHPDMQKSEKMLAVQEFISDAYIERINAVSVDDPLIAQAMLDEAVKEGKIDSMLVADIKAGLKGKARDEIAVSIAESVSGIGLQQVSAEEKAYSIIDSQYGGDQDLKDSVIQRINQEYSRIGYKQAQYDEQYKRMATSLVVKGGIKKLSAIDTEKLQTDYPDHWLKLEGIDARRGLQPSESDPEILSQLLQLKNENPKAWMDQDMEELIAYLSKADKDRIVEEQTKMKLSAATGLTPEITGLFENKPYVEQAIASLTSSKQTAMKMRLYMDQWTRNYQTLHKGENPSIEETDLAVRAANTNLTSFEGKRPEMMVKGQASRVLTISEEVQAIVLFDDVFGKGYYDQDDITKEWGAFVADIAKSNPEIDQAITSFSPEKTKAFWLAYQDRKRAEEEKRGASPGKLLRHSKLPPSREPFWGKP